MRSRRDRRSGGPWQFTRLWPPPAQAGRAHSSVKLNGIKKSADCEFWPRAESGWGWPAQDDGGVRIIIIRACEFRMLNTRRSFRHKPQGIFGPALTQIKPRHSPPTLSRDPVMDTFANLDQIDFTKHMRRKKAI